MLAVVLVSFDAGCGGASAPAAPSLGSGPSPRPSPSPSGSPSPSPPPTASAPAIQYVIVIVQENRSTDNLFHGLPGADTASSGVDSHGNVIALHQIALTERYDLSHLHDDFISEYDGGKMDGADLVHVNCEGRPGPTNGQFAYVNPADVAPYFQMAQHYVFADRMFQSNQGPSFPAHQYLIS